MVNPVTRRVSMKIEWRHCGEIRFMGILWYNLSGYYLGFSGKNVVNQITKQSPC